MFVEKVETCRTSYDRSFPTKLIVLCTDERIQAPDRSQPRGQCDSASRVAYRRLHVSWNYLVSSCRTFSNGGIRHFRVALVKFPKLLNPSTALPAALDVDSIVDTGSSTLARPRRSLMSRNERHTAFAVGLPLNRRTVRLQRPYAKKDRKTPRYSARAYTPASSITPCTSSRKT